jgi:hypothetical protein
LPTPTHDSVPGFSIRTGILISCAGASDSLVVELVSTCWKELSGTSIPSLDSDAGVVADGRLPALIQSASIVIPKTNGGRKKL